MNDYTSYKGPVNYGKKSVETVSILGCGWLGKALAIRLLNEGVVVKGSTSSGKNEELKSLGVIQYSLVLSENGVAVSDRSFFDSDLIIIMVPPGIRNPVQHDFAKMIEQLRYELERELPEQVIFISSTSVYPENGTTVTEEDAFPDSERGRRMLAAEQNIRSAKYPVKILRLGGLIGPGRIPGVIRRSMEKKNGPVNLIHQEDAVRIIQRIMNMETGNATFNVCSPEHPDRKTLYSKIESMGYPVTISVSDEKDLKRKIVSCDKLIKETGYHFVYPDPLEIPTIVYKAG